MWLDTNQNNKLNEKSPNTLPDSARLELKGVGVMILLKISTMLQITSHLYVTINVQNYAVKNHDILSNVTKPNAGLLRYYCFALYLKAYD